MRRHRNGFDYVAMLFAARAEEARGRGWVESGPAFERAARLARYWADLTRELVPFTRDYAEAWLRGYNAAWEDVGK